MNERNHKCEMQNKNKHVVSKDEILMSRVKLTICRWSRLTMMSVFTRFFGRLDHIHLAFMAIRWHSQFFGGRQLSFGVNYQASTTQGLVGLSAADHLQLNGRTSQSHECKGKECRQKSKNNCILIIWVLLTDRF